MPSDVVGRAVAELAEATVAAELLIHTAEEVTPQAIDDAWHTVGVLVVTWADLVAEVVYGQLPIP